MPQEGVILSAVQPLDVFFRLATSLVPLRTFLDAMELDGLLGFLDGTVVVALSQLAALLVGDRVEGNQFRTVVLVAVLFLYVAVDEGLRTVIIGVVARVERLPEAALCRVVLGGTGTEK